MTSRQTWFINRINDCIEELRKLQDIDDWTEFKKKSFEVGRELIYVANEWDKYYINSGMTGKENVLY